MAFSWICDAIGWICGVKRRVKSRVSVVVPTNSTTLRKINAAKSNEKANSNLLTDLLVATRFPIPMVTSAWMNEPGKRIMCHPYARPRKLLRDLAGCMLHDLLMQSGHPLDLLRRARSRGIHQEPIETTITMLAQQQQHLP